MGRCTDSERMPLLPAPPSRSAAAVHTRLRLSPPLPAGPTLAARRHVAASLARDSLECGGDIRETFIRWVREEAAGRFLILGCR